jgi:hypothetical protein
LVVTAAGGEQWLELGQKMIARGPRVNPEFRIVSALSWWRQLASMLQNIQIGGEAAVSGGGDESAGTAKETRSKTQSESSAGRSGTAHTSEDRAKTSDTHSNTPSGSAHSSDSRPATNNAGSSSHSSESRAAPSGGGSSQSGDKAAKGK